MTSNALVTLVAAKEDCFQKPFKTIEAVRISKFIWQRDICTCNRLTNINRHKLQTTLHFTVFILD